MRQQCLLSNETVFSVRVFCPVSLAMDREISLRKAEHWYMDQL